MEDVNEIHSPTGTTDTFPMHDGYTPLSPNENSEPDDFREKLHAYYDNLNADNNQIDEDSEPDIEYSPIK